MNYSDRINYVYDPRLNTLADTATALAIHDEYVRSYSARPFPKFFEVRRDQGTIDPLWHFEITPHMVFSRTLEIPAIRTTERPKLVNGRQGLTYVRSDSFWVSNLGLIKANYFPTPGDLVWWNGYRYQIIEPIIPPESEWGQTGVWLGLVCRSMLVPYGDAILGPDPSLGQPTPVELPGAQPQQVATQ